ncbi:phytanoyl-CoA dioxygenase family protein [Roseateles sp.]|uniref:phytanoyl-CoA dioxygenase family protein n=1 Tax=Roseateles sp. TaxID=1971397 RepID=UPI0039E7CDC0
MSALPRIRMPVERLNALLQAQRHIGPSVDFDVLKELGFFIVRNALPAEVCARYKGEYDRYKASKDFDRTPFHLTEVKFDLQHPLAGILKEPAFLALATRFFGGDVGLYNIRIVKKDATDVAPVFLHQDIGYHHGSFQRYSFFVPLTECNQTNGGLTFFPGTHKFGFLGDAGGLHDVAPAELLRPTPSVLPGDVIVMDSALWHRSGPNETQAERVYYDLHINHADDPASQYPICGGREVNDWSISYDPDFLFENSRTQRLRALYKQLEALQAQSAD